MLHRPTVLEMDQNRMMVSTLSEVKSKKKGGGAWVSPNQNSTQHRPVMPRTGVYTSGPDPVPVPLNSIYTLVFFRNGAWSIYTTISSTLQAAQIVLAERYTLAYLRLYRIKNKVTKYQTRNVSQELLGPTPSFLSQEYGNTRLKEPSHSHRATGRS